MKRAVIVGGGIAGLTAAYRLQNLSQQASLPLQTTLMDSAPKLGGKIVTERVDDFVIEGGPDTFLSYKPWGMALCEELGIADRLHGTNTEHHGSFVLKNGNLYRLPEGLTGMIPTKLGPMAKTPLISVPGKMRMGLDLVLPPRPNNGEGSLDDESLASFISRRLGSEVYSRLIEPLMSGIYAGDGERLSLAATFPQLRKLELEHGGLIKGLLASRRNGARRPQRSSGLSVFVTPRTGLAEIVERLSERLSDTDLVTGKSVRRLQRTPEGYDVTTTDGEMLPADAVILATPAFATARLVHDFDPTLAEALDAIPYVSTATVSVVYPLSNVPHPLNGFGYVIPRAEGRAALGCTWTSSKFPHRAPDGYALLRVFVGRAGQEAALQGSDDDLLQIARTELEQTLGITTPPQFHRIFRWPDAMPQYNLGHLERLEAIDRQLAQHDGLFVAGAAYRGIGIPDCINSGEQAAADVIAHFSNREVETAATPTAAL
jgi:oxygen-dependent protoporphyrinogen oxidase